MHPLKSENGLWGTFNVLFFDLVSGYMYAYFVIVYWAVNSHFVHVSIWILLYNKRFKWKKKQMDKKVICFSLEGIEI